MRKEKREKDLSNKKSRSKSNLPERLSYKAHIIRLIQAARPDLETKIKEIKEIFH